MTELDATKLHSLLFDEGRELVNIKFFPGTDRGLTAAQMGDEAASAIGSALAKGPVSVPPVSGAQPESLDQFLASR